MKKIFTLVSVLACFSCLFSSCNKEPGVQPAKGIEIAITDVNDESFVLSLVPEAACETYAYVVKEGSCAAVDAAKLLEGKVDGISANTFKFSTNPTAGALVSSLEPGAVYTVFAVCGNANGVPGPVASQEVSTTDTGIPYLTSFSTIATGAGNSVELVFNEPVKFASDKAVTAVPYCKMFLTGNPAGSAVKGEVFSVDGCKVGVKFASITTPGTYYLVNFDAGTFTDRSGNECEALASKFTSAVAQDGSCGYEGAYGCLPNADLTYKVQTISEIDAAKYSSTSISINIPAGVNRVDLADGYKTIVSHPDGSKDEYDMAKVINYYGTYYDCVVKPAGKASYGDKLKIVIPTGALQDWYGNVNAAAIEVGPYDVVNSGAPEVESFSSNGNVLTLNFNVPVTYTSGKSISATPYCKLYLTGSPAGGSAKGEVVSVNGKTVSVKFASFTMPGTYYPVNIEAGAFVAPNGNESEEVASKFTSAIDGEGNFGYEGIYGYLENADLTYKTPTTTTLSVENYSSKTFSVNIPSGVARVDLADGYKTVVEHADGTKSEYDMAKVTNYYGTYYDCIVKFAGSAEVGEKASVIIPAGAIMDWYGNVNAAEIVVGPVEIVE